MTPGTPVLVSLSVSPASLSLTIGGTQQYTAIGNFSDGSQLDLTSIVIWTSTEPGVASVTSDGFVTALAEGTVGIVASSDPIRAPAVLTVGAPSLPAETWPVFDVVEMAQESAERAGIEFRAGYTLRTARRSLELLSIEWANRGLNLWTIEGPEAIVLEPGVTEYQLPEDTIDLIEHVVRTWTTNAPAPGTARWRTALELTRQARDWTQPLAITGYAFNDMPMARVTLPEYASIPNKYAAGRPTLINIRRNIQPFFHVWMVPPASPTYHLIYWRLRRMQSVGTGGTGLAEIPWRFIPAMISGLAYYMALKSKEPIPLQKVPLLKAQYEEQFMLASDEDRDRAAFRFIPGGYEFI